MIVRCCCVGCLVFSGLKMCRFVLMSDGVLWSRCLVCGW